MSAKLWTAVLVVLIAGGAWFAYERYNGGMTEPSTDSRTGSEDTGTYAYQCDNGSQFTMSPSFDTPSLTLTAGSQSMFSGTVTLTQMGDGARFEGTAGKSAIVFVGAGEEVQLTVGDEKAVCNPVPNSDMAPWNWGDAGEGGGVKQDVSLIVSESIVGKWQSTTDAEFVREFKDGGAVVDWHDNEPVSEGTFTVFTKEKPLLVAFPIEANAVYVQLNMSGTQADALNFKVTKLTPESLELVYMDRGGVLVFTRVQ